MHLPEGFFEHPGNELKLDAFKTPTDLNDDGFTPIPYIPQICIAPKLAEALSNEIQEYTGYSDNNDEELYLGSMELRELIQSCLQEDDSVSIEEWQKLWLMIAECTERGADTFKASIVTAEPEEETFTLPGDIPDLFKHLAFMQAPDHINDEVIFAAATGCEGNDESAILTYIITTTDTSAVHPNNTHVWMAYKDLRLVEVQRDVVPLIASLLAENYGFRAKPASIRDLMDKFSNNN